MKGLISLTLFVFVLLLLFINNTNIFGQICDRSKQPISLLYDSYTKPLTKETDINTKNLGYINKDSLLAEDELNKDSNIGFRFGFIHEVQFNLKNSGTWDTLDNGDRLWRLRIVCPEAYSTNMIFNKFYLPTGSMLFLYNDENNSILGALTSRNNRESKSIATSFIKGESCIIEYYEPFQFRSEGEIEISKVIHGYVNMINDFSFNQINGFKNSLGDSKILDNDECEVNVKCPEGNDWQKEIYSICKIYYLNWVACTGSLINNTSQNFTPYILTGFHCRINTDVNYWIFEFGWFSLECVNDVYGNTRTFSGADYRADWNMMNGTDFLLLELIETPETDNVPFQLYYNGWDRRDNAPETSVCLHHPGGRDMKISIANNTALETSYFFPMFSCIPDHTDIKYWMVSFDIGITKSGSSGSPLFNPDKRVIGQLFNTTVQQCNTGFYGCDFFGKLSESWFGNGTDDSRLSNWLDPIGSGAETLDGKFETIVLKYGDQISNGQTIDWNAPGVLKIGSSHTSPFTVHYGGNLSLKASKDIVIRPCTVIESGSEFHAYIGTVSSNDYVPPTDLESDYNPYVCDTTYNPPKANMIEQVYNFVPNSVSIKPNPFTEDTRISISLSSSDIITLSVYDLLGNRIAVLANMTEFSAGTHNFTFSGHNINSGVYYVVMSSSTERISRPLMLIK